MKTEIEAKWLNIDHDEFRKKLIKLGAKQVRPKTDMIRTVFDLPNEKSTNGWVRVRNEGNKITLSYKRNDNQSLTGTKEICLAVDNYQNTIDFLNATGFRQKSFQETRRETWALDGAEIDLDEWPWLPTFIEIETKSEADMEKIIKKLELNMKNAMYSSVDLVYQKYYDVTAEEVDQWTDRIFSTIPKWLEKVRRK